MIHDVPRRSDEMSATLLEPDMRQLTASDLRRMLPCERDAILYVAAERANDDYCSDLELTAFEAFGKEDLHGSSSSTQSR
jgi:hypothetical protein